MPQIKHRMSVLYGSVHENVKKSSIPTCHKLRTPYHFHMDFFHENVEKSSIPKCHKLSIPCQFLFRFFQENITKSSIPKCHKLRIPYPFYMFPWKCQKKLDTQMSSTKHPSSPPNAAEVHVEPCTELSTDSTEKCPFSKVKQIRLLQRSDLIFEVSDGFAKLRAYAPGICSNFSTAITFSNMLLQMSYWYLRLSTAIIELPIVVKPLKGSAQQTVLHSLQMKCISQIF